MLVSERYPRSPDRWSRSSPEDVPDPGTVPFSYNFLKWSLSSSCSDRSASPSG
jgi:hypothetical protein